MTLTNSLISPKFRPISVWIINLSFSSHLMWEYSYIALWFWQHQFFSDWNDENLTTGVFSSLFWRIHFWLSSHYYQDNCNLEIQNCDLHVILSSTHTNHQNFWVDQITVVQLWIMRENFDPLNLKMWFCRLSYFFLRRWLLEIFIWP